MSDGIAGFADWPIYVRDAKKGVSEMQGKGIEKVPYFKDGLHLGQLRPRMFSRKHFDDETSDAPNVRCARMGFLLYHFGRHPKHRTLQ